MCIRIGTWGDDYYLTLFSQKSFLPNQSGFKTGQEPKIAKALKFSDFTLDIDRYILRKVDKTSRNLSEFESKKTGV